ncbi:MAG TPA: class I SAM-dependent methyltransferase [Dehalococcoidia bacterium]
MKDEYYLDERVAERYDDEAAPHDLGDTEFYLSLAREAAAAGHPVLELAVGTGRVAIEVARAGIDVTGLDLSPAMLDIARRKAAGTANLALVEGDMADFAVDRSFGLIYIPFRSFLLLPTVEEQKSCLACVRRHLVPDGRLALNFFNPDIPLMAAWMGPARKGLQPAFDLPAPNGERTTVWETRRYLIANQQIDETRIDERMDAGGAVLSRVYRKMKLRYVFRYEMQHLLELSGFEVEALYGGFNREPFTDTSTEMVWVARPREP